VQEEDYLMQVKYIFENFRRFQLLNEVSLIQAKESLNSKKFTKFLYNNRDFFIKNSKFYSISFEQFFEQFKTGFYESFLDDLASEIINLIPNDLTDNQKGLTFLWLLRELQRVGLDNFFTFLNKREFSENNEHITIIETFFHWNQFMEERDLNRLKYFSIDVSSAELLSTVVNNAQPKIKEYQEKQKYKDVDAGTEVLAENHKGWFIAIIHNKGAACQLGKGTQWCTAAPGLNYFSSYYKPEDPLFYFHKVSDPNEKYQFHYGTEQFMDMNDHPVLDSFAQELSLYLYEVLGDKSWNYVKFITNLMNSKIIENSFENQKKIYDSRLDKSSYYLPSLNNFNDEFILYLVKKDKNNIEEKQLIESLRWIIVDNRLSSNIIHKIIKLNPKLIQIPYEMFDKLFIIQDRLSNTNLLMAMISTSVDNMENKFYNLEKFNSVKIFKNGMLLEFVYDKIIGNNSSIELDSSIVQFLSYFIFNKKTPEDIISKIKKIALGPPLNSGVHKVSDEIHYKRFLITHLVQHKHLKPEEII